MDPSEILVLFLFVLLFIVFALGVHLADSWGCGNGREPVDRRVGGEPGRLMINGYKKHKGRVHSVCVCLDVPRAFRFVLRREGPYDRLAKAFRLAREPQLSHGRFDATFYLDAEDPLTARLLEGTEGLRAGLAEGLPRVEERGARLRTIFSSDGRLHIHLTALGMADSDAEASAHEAAMWLGPLVAAMRKVRVEPWETKLLWHRALVARLSTYLVFPLAVLALFLVTAFAPGALSAGRDLLPLALVAGGAALLAWVAWAWRRTFPSERHRRALEWLFLGWPAFVGLAFLLLLALRTGGVLPDPAGGEWRNGAGRAPSFEEPAARGQVRRLAERGPFADRPRAGLPGWIRTKRRTAGGAQRDGTRLHSVPVSEQILRAAAATTDVSSGVPGVATEAMRRWTSFSSTWLTSSPTTCLPSANSSVPFSGDCFVTRSFSFARIARSAAA
jgi:hypothetical protein